MSAATLLGLTAMVYTGLRRLHLHAGFFAGWPIILFLMAERLRNLGKFTFSDITAYRLDQGKVRTMAAILADRGLLLPDRPDGRCRPADQAALRP
jgi:cation/acetate symporter